MKRVAAAVLLAVAAGGCAGSHPVRHAQPRVRRVAGIPFALTPAGRFWARQGRLDAAAHYAQNIPGVARILAGLRVNDQANTVVLHFTHVPQSVTAKLEAAHPGIYVIRTGAPRTLDDVLALRRSIEASAWQSKGVYVRETWPTENGHLKVGVCSNIAKAQTLFDATYGAGAIRVFRCEPTGLTDAGGPTGPKH